ncbi:unnamed protein product [Aphanomyces euteiches]
MGVTLAALALVIVAGMSLICRPRRLDHIFLHVVQPLVFDTLYIVSAVLFVNLATSSVDLMALLALPCSSRCWLHALAGLICLTTLYLSALSYKSRLQGQIDGIRFGFSPRNATIFTIARTAIALLYASSISLLPSMSRPGLYKTLGGLQGAAMLLLWCYNYVVQPCYGSGALFNNLRSVALAASFYLSLVVLSLGVMDDVFQASYAPWTGALASFPCILLLAGIVNAKRAALVHLPELSIPQALSSPDMRVKTTAALTLTLIDLNEWTREAVVTSLCKLDNFETAPHDDLDGRGMAYSLLAVWKLCRHAFAVPCLSPATSEAAAPFHLWHDAPRIRKSAFELQKPQLAPPHVKTLQLAFEYAVALVELPFQNARDAIATLLCEMYTQDVAPLSLTTLAAMSCTLCGSSDIFMAITAAKTLDRASSLNASVALSLLADDDMSIACLLRLLGRRHEFPSPDALGDTATFLANLLRDALKQAFDLSDATDPSRGLPHDCAKLLDQAWTAWEKQYFVAAALEEICIYIHEAIVNYSSRVAVRRVLNQVQPLQPVEQQGGYRRTTTRWPQRCDKYVSATLWRQVRRRRQAKNKFASLVLQILDEGYDTRREVDAFTKRGRENLTRAMEMAAETPLVLLGHLYDSFDDCQVAYIRHLQLCMQLKGHVVPSN